jgi:serine/threonine-protein kinase
MAPLDIPGFEIIDKLGEGGMATVWKARQISLDRIVAIKILSNRLADDDADIERFQQEAQAAAKLKHQGIVQVYDANASAGNYYFVMEYIAGYSVGDWIRRKKVLSEADALLVAECVADAMAYAWNKERIVHCDIKPDNIVIDSDGTVKVADLGLARSISSTGEEVDEIMGTPAYISPEQSIGQDDLDCRADMYSLGAMMYHMVTGRTLFHGQGETQVLHSQVQGQDEDVLDLNPDLSMGFCWLVEKLLMKDRDYRGADWMEVVEDIDLVKAGRMPSGEEFPAGYSTIERSEKRTRQEKPIDVPVSAAPNGSISPAVFWGSIGAFSVAMVIMIIIMMNKDQPKPPHPVAVSTTRAPAPAGGQNPSSDMTPAERRKAQARDMYDYASKWERDHPDDYKEAILKYEKVVQNTRGTRYMLMAEDRIKAVRERFEKARSDALEALQARTQALVKKHDYDIAINMVRHYDGPMANDIADERYAMADALINQKSDYENSQPDEPDSSVGNPAAIVKKAAAFVANGDLDEAREVVESYLENDASPDHGIRLLNRLLESTQQKRLDILLSFRSDIGQSTIIDLAKPSNERIKAKISGVDSQSLSVSYQRIKDSGGLSGMMKFSYDDLSITERVIRLKKLEGLDEPAANMMMGLLAAEARANARAKEYFNKVPGFGKEVSKAIDKRG